MKRYSPHVVGSITFCETDDGEWVKRSDYDALAAELARVTTERDALAKRINHDGTPIDIAALCVEIDEATDELARVKAESLRVVKVGEACKYRDIEEVFFLLNGAIQAHDDSIQLLFPDVIVQPVRLERWEASDE